MTVCYRTDTQVFDPGTDTDLCTGKEKKQRDSHGGALRPEAQSLLGVDRMKRSEFKSKKKVTVYSSGVQKCVCAEVSLGFY